MNIIMFTILEIGPISLVEGDKYITNLTLVVMARSSRT